MPIGMMGRYQVTLHISGISIAVTIHSLDPLECRRRDESCSIDISLRWSENHFKTERFFKTYSRSMNECYLLNELCQ